MWNCPSCQQEVDSEFQQCWNCGTFQDGTPDPEFVVETRVPETTEDYQSPGYVSLEEHLTARYKCCRCGHDSAKTVRIATQGTGLSRIFDIENNHFLGLSCRKCGHTEFFNLSILGENGLIGDILDVLFGR